MKLSTGMFLLFLGLKLGSVIDWSWWWVTAPLWMPLCLLPLVATFFIIAYMAGVTVKINGKRFNRYWNKL